MAGAGYKAFADGDVLTAAQVQTFLQDQAVMRFADSSARTSGLGTAVAEGMVSYLQDTDSVEVYDGSAWTALGAAGIGSNVVVDTETATYSESLAAATEGTAVLSASITPTSATSKVLVQVNANGAVGLSALYNTVVFAVRRNGTLVGEGDAAGNRAQLSAAQLGSSTDGNSIGNAGIVFLDSPASTSALTYTVHLFNPTSATRTVYLNRTEADGDFAQRPRTVSSISLIEVAA